MLHHLRLTCLLTLGALAAFAQTVIAPAPVTETTAMVGLAQGQTAQLNLLNPGVLPPAVGIVCTASVTFFDASGALLKTVMVTAAPGQSGVADLSGDTDLAIPVGQRRDIRAQISIPGIVPVATGATSTSASACTLIPSLEIYDNITGRTLVVLGHVKAIPSVIAASTPSSSN
jgi:hypothetical protein